MENNLSPLIKELFLEKREVYLKNYNSDYNKRNEIYLLLKKFMENSGLDLQFCDSEIKHMLKFIYYCTAYELVEIFPILSGIEDKFYESDPNIMEVSIWSINNSNSDGFIKLPINNIYYDKKTNAFYRSH